MMNLTENKNSVMFLEKIYNQTKEGILRWEDDFSKEEENSLELDVKVPTKRVAKAVAESLGKSVTNNECNKDVEDIPVLNDGAVAQDKILTSLQCRLSAERVLHLFFLCRAKQNGGSEQAWVLYDEENDNMKFVGEAVMKKDDIDILFEQYGVENFSRVSYDVNSLYGSDPMYNLLNRIASLALEDSSRNIETREIQNIDLGSVGK